MQPKESQKKEQLTLSSQASAEKTSRKSSVALAHPPLHTSWRLPINGRREKTLYAGIERA
jgi:hypothetical protein